MTTALFIGRFQPIHLGHIWVLQHILREHSFVKIGIGSTQESRTTENPYTLRERGRMIDAAIRAEHIRKFELFAIPDIPDDDQWVAHVEKIVGHFDVIYTGHPLVMKLMKAAKKRVEELPRWQGISATEVRRRLDEGENWQELVPVAIHGFLEE